MLVQVRSAAGESPERLKTLRLAALADSPKAFGAKYEIEKEKPINFWQNSLRITSWCFVTLADLDIGLLAVDRSEKDRQSDCWVSSWWIQEQYRGQGISRLMLSWVDNLARDKNWQKIGLGVWPDNKRAISAYQKLGFIADEQLMPSRSIPGLLYQPMFRVIAGGVIE